MHKRAMTHRKKTMRKGRMVRDQKKTSSSRLFSTEQICQIMTEYRPCSGCDAAEDGHAGFRTFHPMLYFSFIALSCSHASCGPTKHQREGGGKHGRLALFPMRSWPRGGGLADRADQSSRTINF